MVEGQVRVNRRQFFYDDKSELKLQLTMVQERLLAVSQREQVFSASCYLPTATFFQCVICHSEFLHS